MKKQTYSLLLLFLLTGSVASAQSTPVVPERVTFADISVQLDPDARRIVQQDVNALFSNKQYWMAKLDRVVLYFPMIESILISENVPTDFKYLAVQESSLTPDAVSTSTAVGYWQFKRETATDYGLRVDDEIDERKSITASTHGAAKYLKKNNIQFNNWVASLYSYYLGAGGISKLIPPDWSYAREVALDGRTDRYILRFFAHKIAIENALKFHQTSNRFALIEYQKGSGKSMRTIADELGIDEFELRKYNRWVLGDAVPTDKTYVMAVPVVSNQINDVRQKIGETGGKNTTEIAQSDVGFPVLRRVTTGSGSKNEPILYEINGLPGIQAQVGDNAGTLARKAKISLSSFLRYNDLDESDPVIVNDIYYLSKKRKKALVPFHTVRESETSRSISQRYALRLKKLLRYNRIERGQQLETGRVMWLRERRPGDKPVEIINSPTPPVYDQTPLPPTRPEVAVNTPNERSAGTTPKAVNGSDAIPRNSSERKRYQPKLVDGGITTNDGTSAPAPAQPSVPQPTSVSTSRLAPATTNTSGSNEGSQRVVIVRAADSDGTTKTVPVATTPERNKATAPATSSEDGWRPAGSSATKEEINAYNRTPPSKKTSTAQTGNYAGPLEQQADGSLTAVDTKTIVRPAAPAVPKADVVKAETRSTPTEVTVPEKKEVTVSEKKYVAPAPVTTMPEKKPEKKVEVPASSPTTTTADRSVTTHVVGKGETYYGIARQYDLTLSELLEMNNLTLDNKLEAGQKVKVKAGGNSTAKTEPTVSKAEKVSPKTEEPTPSKTASVPAVQSGVTSHTVSKGENLFRISKMYGVSVEQLQEWNKLSTAYVREGQKIRVVEP